MQQPISAIPGVGDSYSAFAAVYGTAARTSALTGCILRQYRCATGLLSALFNDGVCIALHGCETRLLASSMSVSAVTSLRRGRNGWLLASAACPQYVLAALDDVAPSPSATRSEPLAATI